MNPSDGTPDENPGRDTPSVAERGDDRLLDAMLQGRAMDDPASIDRRVRRLMISLPPRSEAASTGFDHANAGWLRRAPVLVRAMAACLLLGTAIGLLVFLERPVLAEPGLLTRAIERLNEGDSSYLIRITPEPDRIGRHLDDSPTVRVERSRRFTHPGRRAMQWRKDASPPRRAPSGKSIQRLDGALLHVRGDEAVFLVELPGDRTLARGFRGTEFWSNCEPEEPDRLVVESTGPDGPRPDLRLANLVRFATLDLAEMLDGLEKRYVVTGPDVVEDDDGGPPLARYLALASRDLRPGRNGLKRPRSIELWMDPASERIVELRVDGATPGAGEAVGVTMTLQSTEPLEDAVFDPAAYATVKPRRRPPTPERRAPTSERRPR